jgi:hypothetical protein
MEIVAFDTDDRADGNGKAGITWISKTLLNTVHRMNPAKVSNTEGTGTLGGWEKSEMRSYLNNTIKPLIPSTVRNAIVSVAKVSSAYQASDETAFQQTTTDDIWIPNGREIFGTAGFESSGATYSVVFSSATKCKKKKVNGTYFIPWWLRSAQNVLSYRYVGADGNPNRIQAEQQNGVALGFCTN